MSTTPNPKGRQPVRRPRGPAPPPGSAEARRRTLVILEVLGGRRTPTEAAAALGLSPPRYYALEAKALAGLTAACEPGRPGRQRSVERIHAELEAHNRQLARENARLQALVRLAQRAVRVPAAPNPDATGTKRKKGSKGTRKRRPTVRALQAAKRLAPPVPPPPPTPPAQGEHDGASSDRA